MREVVIFGILCLDLGVQSSIFPFIEVFGVKPDGLLALVVSFALSAGNPTGALVGFVGGLLQDILFGSNLGLNALQYMLVGYLVGTLYEKLYVDNIFMPVLILAIASLVKGTIMLGYNFFTRLGIPFEDAFLKIILPETIYTMLLMPLVFFGITRLYQKKFMNKKWHFFKKI